MYVNFTNEPPLNQMFLFSNLENLFFFNNPVSYKCVSFILTHIYYLIKKHTIKIIIFIKNKEII